METLNKDCLNLLLTYLPPKSALALRATCKQLNNFVSHAQLYWFYQHKAQHARNSRSKYHVSDKEAAEIAGRRVVHVKPFTRNCVASFRYGAMTDGHNVFQMLKDQFPVEIEKEYKQVFDARIIHYQQQYGAPNPLPDYLINSARQIAERLVVSQNMNRLATMEGVQCYCRVQGHVEIMYDETPSVGLQTKDYAANDGLYMFQFLYICYDTTRAELKYKAFQVEDHDQTVANLQDQIDVHKSKILALKRLQWLHKNHSRIAKDMKESPYLRKRNIMKVYHLRPEVARTFGESKHKKSKQQRSSSAENAESSLEKK